MADTWADQFNDLGNFLLGFVMIWAYFAFSQFLIIWSADIPEEALWYYHRSQGGWLGVGIFLIALHFVLPFFVLLARQVKRRARLLTAVAVLIFVARIVDLPLVNHARLLSGCAAHPLAGPDPSGGIGGCLAINLRSPLGTE